MASSRFHSTSADFFFLRSFLISTASGPGCAVRCQVNQVGLSAGGQVDVKLSRRLHRSCPGAAALGVPGGSAPGVGRENRLLRLPTIIMASSEALKKEPAARRLAAYAMGFERKLPGAVWEGQQ